MKPLQPGENPREVMSHHKERGPKRYTYTLEDIAAASGYTLGSVRQLTARGMVERGVGADPSDLRAVAMLVQRRRQEASAVLGDAAVIARLGLQYPADRAKQVAHWAARWPRFAVYGCVWEGCQSVLFEPGSCAKHGGSPRPTMVFSTTGYVMVLLADRYHAYHRLVLGCPAGMDVHHRDENRWNNRPDNLEALPPAEHSKGHQFGQ
jgi:hypothetical protein